LDPVRDHSSTPPAPPVEIWQEFGWPQPRPKFQNRTWLHVTLFLLTVGSTTWIGGFHYLGFLSQFAPVQNVRISFGLFLVRGLWYSATVLAILGCHELGHYLACRYYNVDASLPYFIPCPPLLIGTLTGTLGAVIRIREPMRTKRVLFDVGVAGPIAGFAIIVPALILGISMSNIVKLPDRLPPGTIEMGEPLLYKAVVWLAFGSIRDGYTLNLHPVAWAAWFGLLATALNLLPFGQLDGGHIAYAVLGRRSTLVSVSMVATTAALIYFSLMWAFWTVLLAAMLAFFGARHPRTVDEDHPLDRTRTLIALFALVMFILCFTPAPINDISGLRIR
jgi:membrane-associated protease RseP (regulator of RpoE activity)